MQRCSAVRKRGSTDQCTAAPLRNHTLCGIHARMRSPVLWVAVNASRTRGLEKAQAIVRGWLLRKRLSLAGPGVLHRKDLANDEDIVTCNEKEKQHPLEYFAFEENGKIWWFDFTSLWNWTTRSIEPTNPYTKTPLSQDTLRRIHAMWGYRCRKRSPVIDQSTNYEERLTHRWTAICQIFHLNGFLDTQPRMFLRMAPVHFVAMFTLLQRDINTVFPITDLPCAMALRICERMRNGRQAINPNAYVLQSTFTLLWILSLHKDPYTMVFSVMSALYRC